MRIILSKDRAAQLDLLLQSLERYADPEPTVIIWKGSTERYESGYLLAISERPALRWWHEMSFESDVRWHLGVAAQNVSFFCDDDIVFGRIRSTILAHDVLCFSPRLGGNTIVSYPTGYESGTAHLEPVTRFGNTEPLQMLWSWQGLEASDFGYPGSVDGHTFRTVDVLRMLDGKTFPNPTALECALAAGCDELVDERPLMACYPQSVLVGNPVNRVSDQSHVRHGDSMIYSAENLNDSYLAGMRLDLDAIDFSKVNGAHTELDLRWKLRAAA